MTQDTHSSLKQQLQQRFQELPSVVQSAILSVKVEDRLRGLANTHKLHLDQWEILENEVMLTLLGFQIIEDLEKNIQQQVQVSTNLAHTLAEAANREIFEPIRQELERQLEHPDAQAKEVSAVEAARDQALAGTQAPTAAPTPAAPVAAAPPVAPATPPAPTPEIKITRPSDSTAYKPGETSAQRAEVHDDPYREPPV